MTSQHMSSNVAYVEVLPFTDEDRRIPLSIKNYNSEDEISSTISRSQFKKKTLPEAGDTLFVRFSNDTRNKSEKHAILIEALRPGKEATLTGRYNIRSGRRNFVANSAHIKAEFNIISKPESIYEHGQHCFAKVPLDFSPNNPAIVLPEDQDIDSITGEKITEVLLRKHQIETDHSPEALSEAEKIKNRRINYSKRKDLRNENFITIDPPGATDLDDALLLQKLPDGWRSVVAIADVAYYVGQETKINQSAFERGNTVYFPHTRYQMIPEVVVQKASLLKGKDRPVVYVEKFYDLDGTCTHSDVGLGVINSKAQLTYGEYYDLASQGAPLVNDLAEFFDVKRNNRDAQPLFTNLGKSAFGGGRSASPVEYMMIDTNSHIAGLTLSKNIPSYYRNNGPTLDTRLYKSLFKKLAKIGFKIPKNPKECKLSALNEAFNKVQNSDIQIRADNLINKYLLDRAYYSTKNIGHFALGLNEYTHFTSPIRRAADIIVGRAVHSILGSESGLTAQEMKTLDQYTERLNERKQASKDVITDMTRYHAIKALKDLEENVLSATLLYVNSKDVEIMLPQHGLRTKLDEKTLTALGCHIDKKNHELVFSKETAGTKKRNFGRGERIRGQLANVVPEKAHWEFSMIEPA